MVRQRLPYAERKKSILDAAKRVFLRKGFTQSSMEDIVKEAALSKGGLYHYYSSTENMLHDLIVHQGFAKRAEEVDRVIQERAAATPESLSIETVLDKLLDDNEYKALFAMLLVEKKNNPKLQAFYEQFCKESFTLFQSMVAARPDLKLEDFTDPFIVEFMNVIILGVQVLGLQDLFARNREIFRRMLQAYLEFKEDGG